MSSKSLQHAIEPGHDKAHIHTKSSSIHVQLIHNHILQARKKVTPVTVERIGKNRRMNGIWVGEDDIGKRAHMAPVFGRGVAVVCVDDDVPSRKLSKQGQKMAFLVLGQRFGGENKKSSGGAAVCVCAQVGVT